jgi:iron uptake system component EfeO
MITSRPYARLAVALLVALLGAACGDSGNQLAIDDAKHEKDAVITVKMFIQKSLDDLAMAAVAIEAKAPAPDADGWSATADKAAVDAMKAEWKNARRAYESVEGAIAVLFPGLDVSTDARYDAFIATSRDDDPFDDSGVTGVHAIERILWSDQIPAKVVAFEAALPNYSKPAFPASAAEATAFKEKLCHRLTLETQEMATRFKALALDAPSAYRGVIGSAHEQVEKIGKAATGEEESRYAQFTLADMRANIAAARTTYDAFEPWLATKKGGTELDAKIKESFGKLTASYDKLPGDALPDVPEGWTSDNPSAAALATPFGELYKVIQFESDPKKEGSLVFEMNTSASLLGVKAL